MGVGLGFRDWQLEENDRVGQSRVDVSQRSERFSSGGAPPTAANSQLPHCIRRLLRPKVKCAGEGRGGAGRKDAAPRHIPHHPFPIDAQPAAGPALSLLPTPRAPVEMTTSDKINRRQSVLLMFAVSCVWGPAAGDRDVRHSLVQVELIQLGVRAAARLIQPWLCCRAVRCALRRPTGIAKAALHG